MSRMSIGSFLSKAKSALSKSIQAKGQQHTSFVIGNQSADLDSITCALTYSYIQSNTASALKANKCIIPITNIPSSELRLRPELKALLGKINLKPADLITLDDLRNLHESLPPDTTDWTLVDHNVLLGELGEHFSNRVTGCIDHHKDEGKVPRNAEPRVIETTGSCQSLVINYCQSAWNAEDGASSQDEEVLGQDAEIALVALGAILIDTVNFKAKDKVRDHDRKAVEYLEGKIKASPQYGTEFGRDAFFKEINDAKSNLDELSLEEILRKDYKEWSEGKQTLGISSSVRPVEYLMRKEGDGGIVKDILKFAQDRRLDLYAIMTAHNDSGSFARQLLLAAVSDGPAVDEAKKFVNDNGEKLQLKQSRMNLDPGKRWIRLWDQKDLNSSRKQVAPMLREVMNSEGEQKL